MTSGNGDKANKMKALMMAACMSSLPVAAMAQGGPGGHFIENWDLNEDGAVSLDEMTERRAEVFYMFDQDENGTLDSAEYALFDETRAADMAANVQGHGQGGGRMQEGLTLAFNDLDSDGAVSRDEFIARSEAWFVQIDRDADGGVTAADFGPRSN